MNAYTHTSLLIIEDPDACFLKTKGIKGTAGIKHRGCVLVQEVSSSGQHVAKLTHEAEFSRLAVDELREFVACSSTSNHRYTQM